MMSFELDRDQRLEKLQAHIRRSRAITPELLTQVIAEACTRFAAHGNATKSIFNQLVAYGAWTDAILALVELELPQWKLRRIIYDEDEWLCSLSRQPRLPPGLDEVAEASHEILPLALLSAFLQARRDTAMSTPVMGTVPQIRPVQDNPMCCDNFA